MKDHIILSSATIKEALAVLERQGLIANVLFVVNENGQLQGSVSDGDIRRGLLKEVNIHSSIATVMNMKCRFLTNLSIEIGVIEAYKKINIFFVPVVDNDMKIISIINLKEYKPTLPIDAIIMAGGKGKRLLPYTIDTPKPLLKIGDKPVIEYNIDRMKSFGIKNIYISINYLGQQLISYFGDGSAKEISIKFINEEKPLGTIGAAKLVEKELNNDVALIMNCDLLTTIDFSEFYKQFTNSGADMAVAATSYHVDIPYAVLEVEKDNIVQSLKEKPRYTYYSNAGIYLVKKEVFTHIPHNDFFNSTDLMETLIREGKKVVTFPILGYWLDIGNIDDFKKAQEDIKHLNL